jgi:hypothetical protein
MNYAVIWTKVALDRLTDAWIQAADRTAVQQASNRVDQALGTDPWAAGEPRTRTDRLLYDAPLSIYYRIDDSDRKVFVLSVSLVAQP